jgi:hypothetical protein
MSFHFVRLSDLMFDEEVGLVKNKHAPLLPLCTVKKQFFQETELFYFPLYYYYLFIFCSFKKDS